MLQRVGGSELSILVTQGNLAMTYQALGRHKEALSMRRDVYSGWVKLQGPRDDRTILSAGNLSDLMVTNDLWDEAKQFLSEQIPLALEVFGPDNDATLRMRWRYALALESEGRLTEAVAILEDVERRYRRVFGISHPMTAKVQDVLGNARERLSKS